jgi:hypothetical protein
MRVYSHTLRETRRWSSSVRGCAHRPFTGRPLKPSPHLTPHSVHPFSSHTPSSHTPPRPLFATLPRYVLCTHPPLTHPPLTHPPLTPYPTPSSLHTLNILCTGSARTDNIRKARVVEEQDRQAHEAERGAEGEEVEGEVRGGTGSWIYPLYLSVGSIRSVHPFCASVVCTCCSLFQLPSCMCYL